MVRQLRKGGEGKEPFADVWPHLKGGAFMAYTPELTAKYSGVLRRVAWALEIPMTKAIEKIFDQVLEVTDSKMVCEACKDQSFCSQCPFTEN